MLIFNLFSLVPEDYIFPLPLAIDPLTRSKNHSLCNYSNTHVHTSLNGHSPFEIDLAI